jgi:hypothetical protein
MLRFTSTSTPLLANLKKDWLDGYSSTKSRHRGPGIHSLGCHTLSRRELAWTILLSRSQRVTSCATLAISTVGVSNLTTVSSCSLTARGYALLRRKRSQPRQGAVKVADYSSEACPVGSAIAFSPGPSKPATSFRRRLVAADCAQDVAGARLDHPRSRCRQAGRSSSGIRLRF